MQRLGDVPDADVAVAVENGIVQAQGGGLAVAGELESSTCLDLAVVIVLDIAAGTQAVATSAGVQLPAEDVRAWAAAARGGGTLGEVLAGRTGCDRQDPHAALTGGAFPRSDLLEHAIRVAASTAGIRQG
ncbi:unnamed protein product [Prorocentrum cordatum]|uniref:Pyrroline-5-carboxylate reductase n=1 Tax=Prorocentrum cordatum TaxID=2364126 RepID=A0ABN9VUV4_9DINO|nr:unnamed protein product [Polarella glacialis]